MSEVERNVRARFHIPEEGAYLLSHSVGCLPVSAYAHFQNHFLEPWKLQGSNAWEHWLNNLDMFSEALADLFNSESHLFSPQLNLSSALTKLLGALPAAKPKSHILYSECDFPSMGFVIQQLCRSLGLEACFIPFSEDLTDPATWNKWLRDDTCCAFITHVQPNSSLRLPIKEITTLTQDRGIFSIVDIAQSAGIIPIDLKVWQADFVIGSCVKWLCGGPGSGYLWARESRPEQCQPVDVGWFSHQTPMEFDVHHFEYAQGVRRFAGGTPSIMPFTFSAESIRTLQEIGINQAFKHNQNLINRIITLINQGEVRSPTEENKRGGTLVLSFRDNQKALESLKCAGIFCDQRSEGLRFSPHIYNTKEDVDKLIEAINSLKLP